MLLKLKHLDKNINILYNCTGFSLLEVKERTRTRNKGCLRIAIVVRENLEYL